MYVASLLPFSLSLTSFLSPLQDNNTYISNANDLFLGLNRRVKAHLTPIPVKTQA